MPIDLTSIPEARLLLLDTATLFSGSHWGNPGDPDCKHNALELVHEVVTGRCGDRAPPGCTALMGILPRMNEGPWRDDGHRTDVLRPYLRKMLALDRAKDGQRLWAVIDHVYRKIVPDVCDALELEGYGSALRNLSPIVDRDSARAAVAIRDARDVLNAIPIPDVAARAVIDALDAIHAAVAGFGAALAAADAIGAIGARSTSWECNVREILNLICSI